MVVYGGTVDVEVHPIPTESRLLDLKLPRPACGETADAQAPSIAPSPVV
jgi:hypothetical protein